MEDLSSLRREASSKGVHGRNWTIIFGSRNDKLQDVYDATPLSC